MTLHQDASDQIGLSDLTDRGRRLHGVWLVAARSIWLCLAGLAFVTLLVALPIFHRAMYSVRTPESGLPGQLSSADALLLQNWGVSIDAYAAYQTGLIAVFALVFMAAGALLFLRRSEDGVAVFVSLWLILIGLAANPLLDPLIRDYREWQVPVRFLQGASIGCIALFTYIFPNGRFVPLWTRIVAIAWVFWIVLSPLTPFAVADFNGASFLWFGVLTPLSMGIGLWAQIYRYRRISNTSERLQTQWVLFGFAMVALGFLLYGALPLLIPVLNEPTLARLLYINFSETFLLVIPWFVLLACVGIAILRHRLYDIDLLINRALVYGALTFGIAALYVLSIGALGTLFQSSGNVLFALIATGMAAMFVQPLRTRLQRSVNRLMYGERDDPYAVLSRLNQQLKTTLAPETVLPGIAETVAYALKLPYVALAAQRGDRLGIVASAGRQTDTPIVLPLIYQAEPIGQLLIAPRAPGERFSSAENRLLSDVAFQAGAALHAIQLTADLQRSRERIVTAREEERRRLRRDLHDGLGPQLASLTLSIAAARELLQHDTQAADGLLRELALHAQSAVADIRRVVYNLRPPALDALGLVPALREQVAQYQHIRLKIDIDTPQPLPPLPAAVEVATYRIVQEAVTNVARHASASYCTISLQIADGLLIAIRDDGRGLQSGWRAGVGISSMRERAAELGGTLTLDSAPNRGMCVRVHLPIAEEHQ